MLKTGLSEPVKQVLIDMEDIVNQSARRGDQTNTGREVLLTAYR